MKQREQYRWQKLQLAFYLRENVQSVAKELLGKLLVTHFQSQLTAARITEVEAYNGIIDKASHAFGNRRTNRTEVMYLQGGISYVYLCYGIHCLFNVVTNESNIPHAILIRAAMPVVGTDIMMKRTGKAANEKNMTCGPGNLSKAMGIQLQHNGISLNGNELFIADDGMVVKKNQIICTPRIGVDYAQEDASLLYRYIIKDSKWISGRKKI